MCKIKRQRRDKHPMPRNQAGWGLSPPLTHVFSERTCLVPLKCGSFATFHLLRERFPVRPFCLELRAQPALTARIMKTALLLVLLIVAGSFSFAQAAVKGLE